MGAGMHSGTEFVLSLMDVNEEIKKLEECRAPYKRDSRRLTRGLGN
jgi:hypothetical protein